MTRPPRPAEPIRETGDIIRAAMHRERARFYRDAAADLLKLADQYEVEARFECDLANIVAEADAELERRPSMRGKGAGVTIPAMPGLSVVSDGEVEMLRTLLDAAVLCLLDDLVEDQTYTALDNLQEIERFLHAVANDLPRPGIGHVRYGRVSVARIGETRVG